MTAKALGRTLRPLILVGATLLPACDNPFSSSPLDGAEKDLAQARRTWAAQGIASYRFRFQRICFCAPPATAPLSVVVTGNRVTSVTLAESGEPIEPMLGLPLTVEALFDSIEHAIDEEVSYRAFELTALP